MRLHLKHLAFAAVLSCTHAASAQHLWLEPRDFALDPREAVPVKLIAAERLKAPREEQKFDPARIENFQRFSSAGTADIAIKGTPRGTFVFNVGSRPGTHVLAMDMGWARSERDAGKFEASLKAEGLDGVLAERARLGEAAKPGRERQRHSMKTMLQVGRSTDASYSDVAGQALELVPLANPFSAPVGKPFFVRVMLDGKPLADRLLVAEHGDEPTQTARTDAEGRAAITLEGRGTWLLHLVHMRRCASDCDGADWESYWSTLTFAR